MVLSSSYTIIIIYEDGVKAKRVVGW